MALKIVGAGCTVQFGVQMGSRAAERNGARETMARAKFPSVQRP
jgi:hypothetical protein